MATLINGSKIEQCGYEFAVLKPGDSTPIQYPEYRMAREAFYLYGGKLLMRVIYRTEWIDTEAK